MPAGDVYAVFADLLGVSRAMASLTSDQLSFVPSRKLGARTATHARESLVWRDDEPARVWIGALLAFHTDLRWQMASDRDGLGDDVERDLRFVAEFSDSAFLVFSDPLAAVKVARWLVFERGVAARRYPIRAGIAAGTFRHLGSAAELGTDGHMWSTCQFMGSAIVSAYNAERAGVKGCRVLLHSSLLQAEAAIADLAIELPRSERSTHVSFEARSARPLLSRDIDPLEGRFDPRRVASHHYNSTRDAVTRMWPKEAEYEERHRRDIIVDDDGEY